MNYTHLGVFCTQIIFGSLGLAVTLRQQLYCWRAAVQLPPELAVHHGKSQ
jgi:hypothetical protein